MGIIKLPKNSIEFFKNNQDKIFESGILAEGPWNEQLSEKIKSITNTKNAICVNSNGSGLVALVYYVIYIRPRYKVGPPSVSEPTVSADGPGARRPRGRRVRHGRCDARRPGIDRGLPQPVVGRR